MQRWIFALSENFSEDNIYLYIIKNPVKILRLSFLTFCFMLLIYLMVKNFCEYGFIVLMFFLLPLFVLLLVIILYISHITDFRADEEKIYIKKFLKYYILKWEDVNNIIVIRNIKKVSIESDLESPIFMIKLKKRKLPIVFAFPIIDSLFFIKPFISKGYVDFIINKIKEYHISVTIYNSIFTALSKS